MSKVGFTPNLRPIYSRSSFSVNTLRLICDRPESENPTIRSKTATRDDDAETNYFKRMTAEILSHIINCMNLEQFEEVEIRIF